MPQPKNVVHDSEHELHVQALIDTHQPLFEMLISRMISRNPQCCETIARLKAEQKPRKDKSSTFPIYRGIINMYAPAGWQSHIEVASTPVTIAIKTWFAEKIGILELLSNHGMFFKDFDVNSDSVFITVKGASGLAMFQGIFIDHLTSMFKGFNMPGRFGLDTEVTVDSRKYKRLQS